jgi:hypothetical protein
MIGGCTVRSDDLDAESQASHPDKDLYAGLIRVHVLRSASERPVYRAWIMEELKRHGYVLSPGTLYPMLHDQKQPPEVTPNHS